MHNPLGISVTQFIHSFIHDLYSISNEETIILRFSINSEANASELLEHST